MSRRWGMRRLGRRCSMLTSMLALGLRILLRSAVVPGRHRLKVSAMLTVKVVIPLYGASAGAVRRPMTRIHMPASVVVPQAAMFTHH